jgi:hypothetical protein
MTPTQVCSDIQVFETVELRLLQDLGKVQQCSQEFTYLCDINSILEAAATSLATRAHVQLCAAALPTAPTLSSVGATFSIAATGLTSWVAEVPQIRSGPDPRRST